MSTAVSRNVAAVAFKLVDPLKPSQLYIKFINSVCLYSLGQFCEDLAKYSNFCEFP